MKVVIRTDASQEIGTGHVMRCLSLAEELKRQGTEVTFVCRDLDGNMSDTVRKKGYCVYLLPNNLKIGNKNRNKGLSDASLAGLDWAEDAEHTKKFIREKTHWDLLIVDHYGLDCRWEKELREVADKIMVIDDLANRSHDCDILLDQNVYDSPENRYKRLLPDDCRLLLGPKYSILREEFFEARYKVQEKKVINAVERVLVFFGGSDPTGETEKAIDVIRDLKPDNTIFDVVVGDSNPRKHLIEASCSDMKNVNYFCQIENIAELMVKADLSIGAVGTASWERCYLGLVSIVIITADNQKEVAEKLTKENVIINLGCSDKVCISDIKKELERLLITPEQINIMSENCLKLMPVNRLKEEVSTILQSLNI